MKNNSSHVFSMCILLKIYLLFLIYDAHLHFSSIRVMFCTKSIAPSNVMCQVLCRNGHKSWYSTRTKLLLLILHTGQKPKSLRHFDIMGWKLKSLFLNTTFFFTLPNFIMSWSVSHPKFSFMTAFNIDFENQYPLFHIKLSLIEWNISETI